MRRRTAIVTGASNGIGRASAVGLARAGYSVAVNYLQSENESAEVVREIEKIGAEAMAIKADVANLDQVQKLVDQTITSFGSIDSLVNNAGVILMPGGWKEIDGDLEKDYRCRSKGRA